jgi:hypothetical protein
MTNEMKLALKVISLIRPMKGGYLYFKMLIKRNQINHQ